jgi:uncharacterized protein (TIGR02996 family)
MSYKDAFLQTVVENPDDDTPRLIYADWLEEHGDLPRAEFIRVQCELARLPQDDEVRRPTLQEREWTLLFTHAKEWLAELPALEGIKWDEEVPIGRGNLVPCFERGFVSAVLADDEEAFQKQAEILFRTAPIKELRFNHRVEDLEVLLACPALERLTSLGMSATLDPTRVARLAGCPQLSGLTKLDLSFNELRDESVQLLIDSPHLTRLTDLELGSNDIGAAGIRSLSTSPLHGRLQYLGLAGNRIGDAGAADLLSWPNLTGLMLNGNEIGPAWIAGLVDSPLIACLRSLFLDGNNIGNEGVRFLADCPRPIRLDRLGLSYNDIGPIAITYLIRANWLRNLKELALGSDPIRSAGAKTLAVLASSGQLPKLKVLFLQLARIGDAGAVALADSPLSSQLELLELTGNRLGKGLVSHLRERMGNRLGI